MSGEAPLQIPPFKSKCFARLVKRRNNKLYKTSKAAERDKSLSAVCLCL